VPILTAQLEVHHYDGNFCTRNYQNQKHQEQKSEQNVVGVLPDRSENEVQLNEDSTKGKDTAHECAEHNVHVPFLGRNLSGNLCHVARMHCRRTSERQPTAEVAERHGDEEPESHDGEHGGEREGS